MEQFFFKVETFLIGKETLNLPIPPSNNYLLRTYRVFWLKRRGLNKSDNFTFPPKIPRTNSLSFETMNRGQRAGTIFDALKLGEISGTWKVDGVSFLKEALLWILLQKRPVKNVPGLLHNRCGLEGCV